MPLDRRRLAKVLAKEGVDAVVLTTPANLIAGADYGSEFLLGRFEDHVAAAILPADPAAPATLVVPEFDLPHLCESPSWIADLRSYGNPWSSVGAFMGATLEARLDNALRVRLKAMRERLAAGQKPDFLAALVDAVRARGLAGARLAADDPRVGAALAAAGLGAGPVGDALWPMRRVRLVKTEAERAILTHGAEINRAALARVISAGRPGSRESDLTRIYRQFLAEHDARHLGERGMMFGTGDASSFSLPQGGERALTPGDAIVLDCLGTWRGYHMDLARTGVVGLPTAAQRLRFAAVKAALEEVEATRMKAGVHTAEVRTLTREVIARFGLRPELVSVTTHGLGLEVFEFPFPDSLAKGFALEAGMVVNTEVFYRDPELGSFHLEDSVVVGEAGCRALAPLPRELVVFA